MIHEWNPGQIADFLRAGGRFGPSDWVKLDDATKGAVGMISAQIRVDQIAEVFAQVESSVFAINAASKDEYVETPEDEEQTTDVLPSPASFPLKLGGD